jgi:hypothetical protein
LGYDRHGERVTALARLTAEEVAGAPNDGSTHSEQ